MEKTQKAESQKSLHAPEIRPALSGGAQGKSLQSSRPDAKGSLRRGRAASTPPPDQRLQWAGRRAPPPQLLAPFHTTGPERWPKAANQGVGNSFSEHWEGPTDVGAFGNQT